MAELEPGIENCDLDAAAAETAGRGLGCNQSPGGGGHRGFLHQRRRRGCGATVGKVSGDPVGGGGKAAKISLPFVGAREHKSFRLDGEDRAVELSRRRETNKCRIGRHRAGDNGDVQLWEDKRRRISQAAEINDMVLEIRGTGDADARASGKASHAGGVGSRLECHDLSSGIHAGPGTTAFSSISSTVVVNMMSAMGISLNCANIDASRCADRSR